VSVPANGSEAVRVAVNMVHPASGSIRFVARDLAGKNVLSAVDRFVAQETEQCQGAINPMIALHTWSWNGIS
jgi:hypothetical protein